MRPDVGTIQRDDRDQISRKMHQAQRKTTMSTEPKYLLQDDTWFSLCFCLSERAVQEYDDHYIKARSDRVKDESSGDSSEDKVKCVRLA